VTLFQFGDYINKSLIPHRELTNQHNNLKGVSSWSHQIYVQMFNEAGGGNTPRIDEGYYRVPPCEALAHKFFGLLAKAEYTFIQTKIERTTGSSTSAY
jgi:hypothetical protein